MIKPILTDTELWEAIKLDDKKAFNMLFERYWSVMYTSAYNHLRDTELSANAVHDVFVNIWEKRGIFEITSVKNYLTSSARYHVYKSLKERKRSTVMYVDHYNEEVTTPDENSAENKLTRLDVENAVGEHLLKLPKRCREIFLLSRMQHMSNDEIAIQLGISKRTVENQITHALKYLRMHLDKIAILLTAVAFVSVFNFF
jgi:RNA polymerase sigma-70 factor (family 1)